MAHSAPVQLHAQTPEKVHAHLDHERLMDCIHCGLCLSQCPTYAELGQEADSPRGRIYIMRAWAEGRAEPTPESVAHMDLCLGCRNCETACPSGVQYGHLIEGARAHLRENYQRPRRHTLVGKTIESTFPYPNRLEAALLPVRVLRRTGILPLLHKTGFMKLLGPLGDMERMLPPLPPMSKRLKFPESWKARGVGQARVGMITGCVMQVMQSPVNAATARVLTKAGCHVEAPKSQACCGALHAHVGDLDQARAFARKNIEVFEELQAKHELDAIIINAAGCGAALKEYPGWFKGDAEWEPRARAFSQKVKDVSEYLAQPQFKARLQALMQPQTEPQSTSEKHVNGAMNDTPRETVPNTTGSSTLKALGIDVDDSSASKVEALDANSATLEPGDDTSRGTSSACRMTYHDACHLAHGQSIRVQPRDLMSAVPNSELVPLGESEMCCGSAGIYNITQPEMAMQLLERKMKHIAATGAKVVVTGNPGCMMQIMLGAQKFGVDVEVKHPVEILDAATK
ncbi:MAG TPA: heterodisulfide reductase-related iron-sulfur binding cluster [Abditibacteriaceae bacterium]|jgi:Fe-S oxidoreductase